MPQKSRKETRKKPMPAKKPAKRSSSKSPSKSLLTGPQRFNKLVAGLLAVSLIVVGVYIVYKSQAATNTKVERFVDNPAKGLIWKGLSQSSLDSPCVSHSQAQAHSHANEEDLLEIKDNQGKHLGCTHGPDPAPEGIDVRNRQPEPVKTGEADATADAATAGTTTTAATSLIPCDGDGQTGDRVQALYVHASDVPDRYAQFAASFQTWAGNTNNVFVESGLQTGSARNVRWVHDANCNVIVTDVTVSPIGDDTLSSTMSDLQQRGYTRIDRKYLVWVDANVYCGIADIKRDDRGVADNANNGGPSYARIDTSCWGLTGSHPVEAHEMMHNLGGVQQSAPHASAAWHCTDESDVECYQDGVGVVMTYPCPTAEENHFDCNKDDYFYAGTPPPSSYLASYWNTANSLFLVENKAAPTPPPPPPPSGDTTAPTITISSPANGATIGANTTIQANATDNVKVVKMQIYLDGVLKSTSTSGTVSYKWSSRKASAGAHTITVKAYDAAGNVGQSSSTVYK